MTPDLHSRYLGTLLGLACGDAVGTTVEFSPRGSFKPVTDMVGGGPFKLKPGQWTDDTSMALCLADSLLSKGKFDARDQMVRYTDWRHRGYLSSTGRCFDIGMTVSKALEKFSISGEPFSGSTDPHSAGNGSLMRLAPVVLFAYPDFPAVLAFAADSSVTTHGAPEAVESCQLFAAFLYAALAGHSKDARLANLNFVPTQAKLAALLDGGFISKDEQNICGSGYCVESLEAALWCFFNTNSFEHAVLRAVNLGDDADTTGAIVGQIAGAYYGLEGIPSSWLEKLTMREAIESMAGRLFEGRPGLTKKPQPQ
jgi:ADP-ribosyl-[dinitrogen reductase] hydrolase